MARSLEGDWPPGGRGGREELEALARRRLLTGGGGRVLYARWREAMAEIASERILKTTVPRGEFGAFHRDRHQEGITDDQLAESFLIFVTAALHGRVRVHHSDLWRTYVATWARWVDQTSADATGPLRGAEERSDWQR